MSGQQFSYHVFFVSDHTGVTAEALGRSLLAQFNGLAWTAATVPFVDAAALPALVTRVARAAPALVFSTLTDPAMRAALKQSGAPVFDLFDALCAPLAATLRRQPQASAGHTHGVDASYEARIAAVHYALAADDGLAPERLPDADLVLTGVSRAGKTPTALYLALHYGLKVANVPLTPDDFERGALPSALAAVLPRVAGLTLAPERLAAVRTARRPGSPYASLEQCRDELARAETLMRRHGVRLVDASASSVEEIAARLLHGGGQP